MSKYDALMVSETVHEKEIELADGSKQVLHFKEVPAVTYRQFLLARQSDDDEVRASAPEVLIVASLCEPDGTPAITMQQARKLKGIVAGRIFDVVLDINNKANEKNA